MLTNAGLRVVFLSAVVTVLSLMTLALVWRFSALITDPRSTYIGEYVALVSCQLVVAASAYRATLKLFDAMFQADSG